MASSVPGRSDAQCPEVGMLVLRYAGGVGKGTFGGKKPWPARTPSKDVIQTDAVGDCLPTDDSTQRDALLSTRLFGTNRLRTCMLHCNRVGFSTMLNRDVSGPPCWSRGPKFTCLPTFFYDHSIGWKWIIPQRLAIIARIVALDTGGACGRS